MVKRSRVIALVALTLLLAACAAQATPAPTTAPAPAATSAPPASPTVARPAPTGAPTAAALPTTAPTSAARFAPSMPPCSGSLPLTAEQTEGPYYKANTPQRANLLEPGIPGERMLLTGFVLTADCKPVARAWLDFWQTDGNGAYDNDGFKMRGHQFTGDDGRYTLETVMPGLYPGRTRHIHVKARAPNGPVLTSQIYFPGEARNQSDGIFSPTLLASMQDGGKVAVFHFVIKVQ